MIVTTNDDHESYLETLTNLIRLQRSRLRAQNTELKQAQPDPVREADELEAAVMAELEAA